VNEFADFYDSDAARKLPVLPRPIRLAQLFSLAGKESSKLAKFATFSADREDNDSSERADALREGI
jgi:hypothetical protein